MTAGQPSPSQAPSPAYSPGLDGVIAGETAICQVDPNAGLLYRGYDADELAPAVPFEDIVWLLFYGDLPTSEQSESLRARLAADHALPARVVEALRLFPADAAPNDVLRTGVSMLGAFDPDVNDHSHAANLNKALRLVARVSTLVTSGWRIALGKAPVAPAARLTHSARFLFCLTGREPEPWQIHAMDVVFALYAEHEFNASTFSARVTASTMADMYAAVTSALGTLKGPLHGGANEQAMAMLRQIQSPDAGEAWIMQRLARKEKIMGFGHRIYRSGDSRVPVMRELARDLGRRTGHETWVDVCERLEEVMRREKGLYANVDLYAAPVLQMLGIPWQLNTPVFACSRVAGWCAHVIEQHDHNRLIRPRSLYTGPSRRPLPSRSARRAG
jgi:2-methylcitrate synthase/citrate synthase II